MASTPEGDSKSNRNDVANLTRLSYADKSGSEVQVQRATWHDYHAPGVYMLTLCSEGRRRVFGELDGEGGVNLTPLGCVVKEALRELPGLFPELVVVRSVVMPDHLHAVVQVERPMKKHLGAVVRRLKYVTTVAYLRELDRREGGAHRVRGSRPSRREREMRMGVSADLPQTTAQGEGMAHGVVDAGVNGEGMVHGVVDAGVNGEGIMRGGGPCVVSGGTSSGGVTFVAPLWQEGYHDRILKEWGQFPKMVRYVEENPQRAWIKRQHPRLFHDKWTLDVPVEVPLARALYREARALAEVPSLERFLFVDRSNGQVQTRLRFRAMGNYFLIHEATLLPLRVSRRVTPGELLNLQTRFLNSCGTEGAVIVTPCVSLGEQTIVDTLLTNGYRVIRLQHEAMSMHYSPSTRYLPYVASGQMLLLAPWPDQPLSHHVSKGNFELLNAVSRVLCGLPPS